MVTIDHLWGGVQERVNQRGAQLAKRLESEITIPIRINKKQQSIRKQHE